MTAAAIESLFEDLGLKATRPRRMISERIARLGQASGDFATEDLWRDLRRQYPGIGRATVFRSVDILVRNGVLDRVELSDGRHRYRVCGAHHHHHHITCSGCRRMVEIDACLSGEALSAIASSTDFAIEGHSLELYGRCPTCQEG